MSDIYDELGGLHYFSENPSNLIGASYRGGCEIIKAFDLS